MNPSKVTVRHRNLSLEISPTWVIAVTTHNLCTSLILGPALLSVNNQILILMRVSALRNKLCVWVPPKRFRYLNQVLRELIHLVDQWCFKAYLFFQLARSKWLAGQSPSMYGHDCNTRWADTSHSLLLHHCIVVLPIFFHLVFHSPLEQVCLGRERR